MKGGTSEDGTYGAGAFGNWSTDADGKPVYVYAMDHARDPRAVYQTSLGESRDHWHQVGTGEFVATVHNEGYCQLYDWSRGGKLVNRWDPDNGHFAGGFLLVELNGQHFSTLWQGLPEGATQERRWGCNYAERITRVGDVEIAERIEGNNAMGLQVHWRVINHSTASASIRVTAPWWVNAHPITPAPLMTYGARRWTERRRARKQRGLNVDVSFTRLRQDDWGGGFVYARYRRTRLFRSSRLLSRTQLTLFPESMADGAQLPWFIAAPTDDVERDATSGMPKYLSVPASSRNEKHRVAGPAIANLSEHPKADMAGLADCPASSGVVIALAWEHVLLPGEHAQAYYFVDCLSQKGDLDRYKVEYVQREAVRGGEVTLARCGCAALDRELRWHSAYLKGGALYSSYHDAHVVDQGSAYSYQQGLSGAPRDFALFILPMVYLHPYLAKDMLRYLFVCQHHRSGKLPYANVLNGKQRGYVLHSFSSDLDLFLLWAAGEYLGATSDFGFLREELPFYPKKRRKSGTVLEHIQAAFAHLRDGVGLGPHGLLRCGSGDWNDVLLGYSRVPPLTFLRGESSLNAGLAALALPRLADVLEARAPAFAAELRAFGVAQGEALRQMWCGRWAARGYLGYANKKLGEDRLFLDAQSFGVLANVWDAEQRAALFGAIEELCVSPQKVGALALWPPMKGPMLVPGSDTNGGTWAAIDALTAWAWAQHDPQRAWDFFLSTTLAAHAEAYPNVWYGVWSGPDSFNAHYHPRAGETFCHNFTPMTDFPIMNMNRHAGPLLNAIKFAGIEPRGGVIEICPRVPGDTFAFSSPLISIQCTPEEISGEYRPICDGVFRFRVAVPRALRGRGYVATCNDESATCDGGEVTHEFSCEGSAGSSVRWRIGPV